MKVFRFIGAFCGVIMGAYILFWLVFIVGFIIIWLTDIIEHFM